MNFDNLDKIIEGISKSGLSDSEKNAVEYTLTASAELGSKYGETAYAVPFAFINFSLIAHQFRDEDHQAFTGERTERFKESEFPELQYGETEDQPNFATVFVDYMNMSYAATLNQLMEEMQHEGYVDLTFDGERFVYSIVDPALLDDEIYEAMVGYANIFL